MAGYGQFTSYEPAAMPGAYKFKTMDGKELLLGGPSAENLKARLDAYDSVNMPQVAGPGGGPTGGNRFNKSMADLKGAGAKIGEQNREALGINAPPVAPAAAAPGAPAGGGGGLRPFMVNGINTGYLQDASGQLFERTGGRAAVTRDQLMQKATQGVATPTAESQTVAGGFERNPEYEEQAADARNNMRLASEEQRAADLKSEEAGRGAAVDQFVATTAERDQQQRLIADVNQQVAQAQAVRDQALKEYTGSKVDPGRIFKNPVNKLASALATAAGAYAATVGHTQNFAQQIIDSAIARDINAQEADIRIKKDKSDTALGDLMRRGMTLDQAKGTLKTIQGTWAQQQLALARGTSANEAINAKYDGLLAKFDKDAADEAEQYRQKSLGTATKAVQAQVMYPQAGSGGGLTPVAPGKALGIAGTTAGTEGTVAGTAKTLSDLEGGGKKSQGDQKALAAIATADTALKSLDAYGDDDIAPTLDNQDIASSAYHRAKDLVLGAGSSARSMSNRDRSMIQDTEAAKGYVKSLTSVLSGQGALSGPEGAAAEKGLAPGATVGDLKRAVAVLKTRAQAIIDAGGSVPVATEAPKQ